MKVRIMFRRTVQPPFETLAVTDFRSQVIEVNDIIGRFLNGADCGGCGISIGVAGIEIVDED